jgi:hypothetical protein
MTRRTSTKVTLSAAAMAALAANTGCEWLKAKPEEPSKGIAYRKAEPTEPQPVSLSARIADTYKTVTGISTPPTATTDENFAKAVEAYTARRVNDRNVTEIATKTAVMARLFSDLEDTTLAQPETETAKVLENHAAEIFKRMNLVLGATSSTQTAAVATTGTARWDVLDKVADIATRYNGIAKAHALNDGRVTLEVTLGTKVWELTDTFRPVTSSAQFVVSDSKTRERAVTETATSEPGFDLMKTVDGAVVKLDTRSWTRYNAKTDADAQALREYTSALCVTVTAGTSISLVEGYDAKEAKTRNTYLLAGTKLVKLPATYGKNELKEILQKYAALEQSDAATLSVLHLKGYVSKGQLKNAVIKRAKADRDFGALMELMDASSVRSELEKYFATPEGKGAYGRIGVMFEVGTQVRELGLTSADNPQTYLDAEIPLGEHLSVLGTTLTARILAESDEKKGYGYFTPGDNLGLGRRTEILPADKAERLRLLNREGKKLNGWHEANPHQLNPTTWGAMKGKTFYIQGYQKFTQDGK